MKSTASTQTYSLAQLPSMLAPADLAIQLDSAQTARRLAHAAYHDKIHEFERFVGSAVRRINAPVATAS